MVVRQRLARLPVGALIAVLGYLGVAAHAANQAVETRMKKDITFLASDECEGRGVTTKGINLAADYIAEEFKKAGLKPANADGSYFQPFTIQGSAKLGSPNSLVLRGPQGQEIHLKQGTDFQVIGLSGAGKVTAPLVFAGYGITAEVTKPRSQDSTKKTTAEKSIFYDDYQNLDVAGKIVVLLRKSPRYENTHTPFPDNAYHASLTTKVDNAERHKAAGVLIVNDRAGAKSDDRLMDFNYLSFAGSSKLPGVHVHRLLVDRMLESALGTTLADVEQDIDRDLKPGSAPLTGWSASLETQVSRVETHAKNIVGVLEGSGPLAHETVVIGAHYDHLGYGAFGSLAKRSDQGKAIHHGADDNGSGTTMLMELARRFGKIPMRQGRRLVFMAFSGEELGLLGSAHYCSKPLFPLAETVAMVNMDMVGRLRPDKETHKDKLIVYGTGSAKTFDKLIDSLNAKFDFQLRKVPTGMGPSDQQSFYVKKIPVFFFFTDDHPDYHRPSDTSDKINLSGMSRIADLVENLISYLESTSDRPQYVEIKASPGGTPRMTGPRLGIMPSYGDDKEGVLVGGVTAGMPAAKAGLREGDRIVEMAGKPV
jgi:hypothetical protein